MARVCHLYCFTRIVTATAIWLQPGARDATLHNSSVSTDASVAPAEAKTMHWQKYTKSMHWQYIWCAQQQARPRHINLCHLKNANTALTAIPVTMT